MILITTLSYCNVICARTGFTFEDAAPLILIGLMFWGLFRLFVKHSDDDEADGE